MRLLLDACVLYPTVMREMLLGAARAGFFRPLWSDRILEEWARAAARHGDAQEAQARGEIALTRAAFPDAAVTVPGALEARLWLPDEADIHVLAAAVAGSADRIVTLNRKDFPRGTLAEEGLDRIDPDGLLMGFWQDDPAAIGRVGADVLEVARRLSDPGWEIRPLLKKARLPRLAKALAGG
jgi:hypothetical protein